MTMTEGEVSSWLAKVGDEVNVGDVVCEVMTDKVDMEVESTASGTLVEIVAESGMVDVGEPIAWLEGEDDGLGLGDLLAGDDSDVPTAEMLAADHADDRRRGRRPARPAAATPAPEPAPDAAARTVRRGAPRARHWPASAASTSRPWPAPARTAWSPCRRRGGHPARRRTAALRPRATTAAPRPAAGKAKDRSAMIRAAVARKMTESAAVPQFTVWRDVVLDEANERRGGVSWTTALLRAYAAALREVPDLLNRWDADDVQRHAQRSPRRRRWPWRPPAG